MTCVLKKINRLEPFWPFVNVEVDIDLSKFGLPEGKRSLHFEFIDPVWAGCVQPTNNPLPRCSGFQKCNLL